MSLPDFVFVYLHFNVHYQTKRFGFGNALDEKTIELT